MVVKRTTSHLKFRFLYHMTFVMYGEMVATAEVPQLIDLEVIQATRLVVLPYRLISCLTIREHLISKRVDRLFPH